MRKKDKQKVNKKSGIHKIYCQHCNKIYTGKTTRNIEERFKEGKPFKSTKTDKSAVAAHSWNDHIIDGEVKC
jgi:GIY-YIG catalytic domain.